MAATAPAPLWDVTGLQGACKHLGVDAIHLAPVLTDPELLDARRVDELDLVAAPNELVVDVPRFTTRLDGHVPLGRVEPELVLERRETVHGPSWQTFPSATSQNEICFAPRSRPLFLIADLSWAPSFCVTERMGVPAANATRERSALFSRETSAARSFRAGSSLSSQPRLLANHATFASGWRPALAGREFHPRTAA
ncbi:MAG: hypothetical protein ABSF69_23155 [Polyangiaceae bacterium]